MRKGLTIALGLGAMTMLAVAANAQTDNPPPPEAGARPPMPPMPPMARFAPMPKTRAEAIARAHEEFAALDKNRDGFVTRDELFPRGGPQPPAPPRLPMPPRGPEGPEASGGADPLFAMMDTNHDGQISKAEFEAFHKGGTRRSLEVTRDNDGHERRTERVIVMRGDGVPPPPPGMRGPGGMPPMGMERLRAMMVAMRFDGLDANHDGKLSAQEIEAGALARFDRLDTDHDGTLSAQELAAGAPRFAMRIRERERREREPRGPEREHGPMRGPGYDLPATPPAPLSPQGTS